jgi:hypothetical protein
MKYVFNLCHVNLNFLTSSGTTKICQKEVQKRDKEIKLTIFDSK